MNMDKFSTLAFILTFVGSGIILIAAASGTTTTMDYLATVGVPMYAVPALIYTFFAGKSLYKAKRISLMQIARHAMYPVIIATYAYAPDYFIPLFGAYILYTGIEGMDVFYRLINLKEDASANQ